MIEPNRSLKLGRKPARIDIRTPKLGVMLSAQLPAPPASCDHGALFSGWKLWRNGDQLGGHDQTIPGLGDCTAVSVASAIRVMTGGRGGEIELSDEQVVGIYEANGYDPTRPATDQGAVELDVLDRWCQDGYAIGRQAPDVLTAYGTVDYTHPDSVRRAIAMLGGLYIGLALPDYALVQGTDWCAQASRPPSVGGHAVFLHGYDADWLYLNSWGERKRMDWGFFRNYCDESYGLLSRDWLDTRGHSPMHESFDVVAQELQAARSA
ncbi:hypothetical protein NFI95_05295 [Acetobacteraceae bacterium KSS8]|uniref:Peptidase C39-like domain-containing protein n=1 Tax=Endosaccharibacter trunci TaxID=2812733 RepID=A0ABT1W4Q3_9PROT|nr:hypothetical protein [Acetobacteraceae bacterium KSS8]